VILYRMLTGRLPFESNNPMELVVLHRDAPPPPISQFRDDAPAALESTATAALAKDPADRPADGAALLAELGVPAGVGLTAATGVLSADATRVLPVAGAAASSEPPRGRKRAPLIAAALLVLALAGGALAYALTRSSSPSRPGTISSFTLSSTRKHATSAATTTAPSTSTQQTTQQTTTAPLPTTAPQTAPPPTTTAPPTTAP
jgi:serine/threonine-protein kinase